MTLLEKLTKESDEAFSCGDPYYSLDEVRAVYQEVVEITPGSHWLALGPTLPFDDTDPSNLKNCCLEFALFRFVMSDVNGTNTKVGLVFQGSGPTGSLRECRHIYWGPDSEGYTFYLPADAVIQALQHLKKYFDFN